MGAAKPRPAPVPLADINSDRRYGWYSAHRTNVPCGQSRARQAIIPSGQLNNRLSEYVHIMAGPVCSYFPGYMTLRTYRLMRHPRLCLNLYINLYFLYICNSCCLIYIRMTRVRNMGRILSAFLMLGISSMCGARYINTWE